MDRWFAGVTAFTENLLTWRKRRILKKKAKQKKRHVIIEWLDAFLWAAFVVLHQPVSLSSLSNTNSVDGKYPESE